MLILILIESPIVGIIIRPPIIIIHVVHTLFLSFWSRTKTILVITWAEITSHHLLRSTMRSWLKLQL